MGISLEEALALEQLENKIKTILPALYRDTYEEVLPVSMGSAPLKIGLDGNVAWDQMWASFCDLAMAGGPPHRGALLQPASAEDIQAAPEDYRKVTEEICRGISMVTGFAAAPSNRTGWVEITVRSAGMAGWLVRAIVMENVMARHEQSLLLLPAGPQFRVNKEIKNVITALAKTSHYWTEHTPQEQQVSIENSLSGLSASEALLEPALHEEIVAAPDAYRRVLNAICDEIEGSLHLPCFKARYAGWVGIECSSVRRAIWMLRAMVVENILARRENEVLFLPVNPEFEVLDRTGRLIRTFSRLYHLSHVARV